MADRLIFFFSFCFSQSKRIYRQARKDYFRIEKDTRFSMFVETESEVENRKRREKEKEKDD